MNVNTSAGRTCTFAAFVLVLLSIAAAVPATAAADGATIPAGGGANNVVLAPVFADGASHVRSNLQVSQAGGNTVASSNIASALATGCTGCHATAVAVQVVLVTGNPQYFVPANVATAVNGGCTSCGTFAYAWQYTPQVDRPVMLTPEGRQEVAQLRAEIASTAEAITPVTLADDFALQAQLDALTSQLKDVIDSDIAHAGAQKTGVPVEHVDQTPTM